MRERFGPPRPSSVKIKTDAAMAQLALLVSVGMSVCTWGLSIPLLESTLELGCRRDEMPVLLRIPAPDRNNRTYPQLVCQASKCMERAHKNCTHSIRCHGRDQWMQSFVRPRTNSHECCDAEELIRSALIRNVPVIPGQTAIMRGFHTEDYQFGEAIVNIEPKANGILILQVARFGCGPPFPNGRGKRQAGREIIDHVSCRSEWDSRVVATATSLKTVFRRRKPYPSSATVSIVDDTSCGVQVTNEQYMNEKF